MGHPLLEEGATLGNTRRGSARLASTMTHLDLARLQVRVPPLWELEEEGNKARLRPGALPDDELDAVQRLLVGDA